MRMLTDREATDFAEKYLSMISSLAFVHLLVAKQDAPSMKKIIKSLRTKMVDIHPVRLRIAIAFRASSVSRLASTIGENRQTIHAMAIGERVKRCHWWRRARISQTLGISENFLAGSGSLEDFLKELKGR